MKPEDQIYGDKDPEQDILPNEDVDYGAWLERWGWRRTVSIEAETDLRNYSPGFGAWKDPVYETNHSFEEAVMMQLQRHVESLGGLRKLDVWVEEHGKRLAF